MLEPCPTRRPTASDGPTPYRTAWPTSPVRPAGTSSCRRSSPWTPLDLSSLPWGRRARSFARGVPHGHAVDDQFPLGSISVRGPVGAAEGDLEINLPRRFTVLADVNAARKTTLTDALYLAHLSPPADVLTGRRPVARLPLHVRPSPAQPAPSPTRGAAGSRATSCSSTPAPSTLDDADHHIRGDVPARTFNRREHAAELARPAPLRRRPACSPTGAVRAGGRVVPLAAFRGMGFIQRIRSTSESWLARVRPQSSAPRGRHLL